MTDREKLIELLDNTGYFINREVVGYVANHLLANGVVVREKGEWIDHTKYVRDFLLGSVDCSVCKKSFGNSAHQILPSAPNAEQT